MLRLLVFIVAFEVWNDSIPSLGWGVAVGTLLLASLLTVTALTTAFYYAVQTPGAQQFASEVGGIVSGLRRLQGRLTGSSSDDSES